MSKNSPNTVIANEIKLLFKFCLLGLLIGLLSFPVFYFMVYKVNELEEDRMPSLEQLGYISNEPAMLGRIGSIYDSKEVLERNRQNLIRNYIKMIKEYILKQSFIWCFYVWLISLGILMSSRYIYLGINWVNKNATI